MMNNERKVQDKDYKPLATGDYDEERHIRSTAITDDDDLECIELYDFTKEGSQNRDPLNLNDIHVIRNDAPQAISRPPTKYRDWIYGICFILHFLVVLCLSFAEEISLRHAALSYNRSGSEASIVMIVTLLGSVLGIIGLGSLIHLSSWQEWLLRGGLLFSIILKVCIANILFIMKSYYSLLGLILIVSVIWDYSRYSNAKSSIPFTMTLIELINELLPVYGMRLMIACGLILGAQTCILLWWGAFFIGLIATISMNYVWITIIPMLFSLFWITQVFHCMISFLIGGCILRLFIDDDSVPSSTIRNTSATSVASLPYDGRGRGSFQNSSTSSSIRTQLPSTEIIKSRVNLYTQCLLTTSFGSICKAALWIFPSQGIMLMKYWMNKDGFLSSSIPFCFRPLVILFDRCFLNVIHAKATRYHKLSLCSLAVYGRTLLKTSEDQLAHHPTSVISSLEEYSDFILSSFTSAIAAITAIIFALCSESKSEKTWPLFFLICYLLVYCGISLSLSVLSTAVDALIVVSSVNPAKLSEKNQLVLLRFLRLAESELR
jgi:hypothetical protein